MGETLRMSAKERRRLVELESVSRGERSLAEAARRLGLSYRQAKRSWRRYRRHGAKGLVHGSRGQPSNRAISASVRKKCLELYQQRLDGFGPTLATENAVDMETAVHYAQIVSHLRLRSSLSGRSKPDLWIAAWAVQHAAARATRNAMHFEDLPNLVVIGY